MTNSRWLDWCRELQAIAQNGLTYGTGHFDLERYKRLQEIAAEMVGAVAAPIPESSSGLSPTTPAMPRQRSMSAGWFSATERFF